MIKTEIKDTTHFKLTIAKEETRIKIPATSTPEERAEIIEFFKKIKEKVGVPEYTLRGAYQPERKKISIRAGFMKNEAGELVRKPRKSYYNNGIDIERPIDSQE